MTDLRTAAQQALEAICGAKLCEINSMSSRREMVRLMDKAITALRAALAEPVQQGCDHCNHPLYAAIKCRVCGRVTEPVQEPDSPERRCGGPGCDMKCCQPVQEPVAWLRVIDEAMVTHHLGVADPTDDYETAKRKMNTLLSAAQDIGTYFAKQAEPETCTWQQDGDSDSGVYGTSCGGYFNIEDGTPEDNKMAWCCYCGRKLTQALITEDEDD